MSKFLDMPEVKNHELLIAERSRIAETRNQLSQIEIDNAVAVFRNKHGIDK